MFELSQLKSAHTCAPNGFGTPNSHAVILGEAIELYNRALSGGRLKNAINRLAGKTRRLIDLNQVTGLKITCRHYVGIQNVTIGSIVGTLGRSEDFDSSFSPLSDRSRTRWQSIAVARLSGIDLNPVSLIQVGDVYFVQDGHHRISVAHALGQASLEAEVVAWDAIPPFPWQKLEPVSGKMQVA